ncbi:MAG: hypothetical protein AAGK00_18170 [Pseudomonadota bacterium]
MHKEYARFVVDWVPGAGTALARFGRHWTGWCADLGRPAAQDGRLAALRTQAHSDRVLGLRGLHAPLTPVFELRAGTNVRTLSDALAEVANTVPPVMMAPARPMVFEGRVELRPSGPSEEVGQLLAELSTVLARFAGRIGTPSSTRFAIPLSAVIGQIRGYALAEALAPWLSDMRWDAADLGEIALKGAPVRGGWRVIERFRLTGPERCDCGGHPLACEGTPLLYHRVLDEAEGSYTPEQTHDQMHDQSPDGLTAG